MKSWIHTARFSRSKSAEKGSGTSFTIVGITVRNSIFVKSSLSANGFFCFLLITMNSTCERPSSHFSRDGLDGRPSSLARVKLKQRIMDVHIFPQDSKWKKNLKISFYRRSAVVVVVTIFTPNVVQLQGLAQILRWQPNFQETGPYFMVVIPHPWAWHGRGSDFKRPHKTVHSLEERGEGLENWYLSLFEATGNTVRARWGRDFYGYDIEKVERDEMRCNCIALLMKFVTKHRE